MPTRKTENASLDRIYSKCTKLGHDIVVALTILHSAGVDNKNKLQKNNRKRCNSLPVRAAPEVTLNKMKPTSESGLRLRR